MTQQIQEDEAVAGLWDEYDPSDDEPELDQDSKEFIDDLVTRIVLFCEKLAGFEMYPYQRWVVYRIVESVVINDGEEITVLTARQAGKTQSLACVISGLMVILPVLASVFPDVLGDYKDGFWVGCFAPVQEQADTLFSRVERFLTSPNARQIMADDEIGTRIKSKANPITLTNGSLVMQQTANPKAKVESKTYHMVIIDEAQDTDDTVVQKSIQPMLAATNGTNVKIGTPGIKKNHFFTAIKRNQRRQTARGRRQNHFQFDHKYCAKYNPNYAKFIKKEKIRLGEDSDDFLRSYCLKWMLDRGMFTSEEEIDECGDPSMDIVRAWTRSPVVVGIDPARKQDSTVITVLWVDWSRPDALGYFDHRILNWLELHGTDWEEQYFQTVQFLANYNVWKIGVDTNGVGDAFASRIRRLMPYVEEVVEIGSSPREQHERWKHLESLMQRRRIGWPASSRARRTRVYKRFVQQMGDLEKNYTGPYMQAEAPDEAEAHDDYPDSAALAAILTKEFIQPQIEVHENPFYDRQR